MPGSDTEESTFDNSLSAAVNRKETEASDRREVITIISFDGLEDGVSYQQVPIAAELSDLNLPVMLKASVYSSADSTQVRSEPKAIVIKNVTWRLTGENGSSTEYESERSTSCTYYFQAVLPEGYEAGNAALPQIEVLYGFGDSTGRNSD